VSAAFARNRLMSQGNATLERTANRRMELSRSKQASQAESEAWMTVYLDVLTLLLAVFLLMLLNMEQPHAKATVVMESAEIVVEPTVDQQDEQPHEARLAAKLRDQLVQRDLQDVEVTVEQGRVNVKLPDRVLFESSRADLIGSAAQILQRIVPVLLESDYPISVEGHTDNVPIRSQRFPSNWDLSSARASTVIRFLQQQGVAVGRMRAVGYADTVPLVPNDTDEGRGTNRRVNLIIHVEGEPR